MYIKERSYELNSSEAEMYPVGDVLDSTVTPDSFRGAGFPDSLCEYQILKDFAAVSQ
jgi:hypothetical protein